MAQQYSWAHFKLSANVIQLFFGQNVIIFVCVYECAREHMCGENLVVWNVSTTTVLSTICMPSWNDALARGQLYLYLYVCYIKTPYEFCIFDFSPLLIHFQWSNHIKYIEFKRKYYKYYKVKPHVWVH
jgi:hypothetical protein